MTRILEVEEDGTLTLPSDVLVNSNPHARYMLETRGERIILRLEPTASVGNRLQKKRRSAVQRWKEERRRLSEEISRVWPEGVSATDIISEMRR